MATAVQKMNASTIIAGLDSVFVEILSKMETELSRDLKYHNYEHTLDVLEQALLLASADNCSERDAHLLTIAAIYHDAGFLIRNQANEPLGAEMAVTAMRSHGGYSELECSQVSQMILDTTLLMTGEPQQSNAPLSPYLLDADLSNLGRDCFWVQTKALADEVNVPATNFFKISLELMERHNWQSGAAVELYQQKKEHNMSDLRQIVNSSREAP